MEHLEALELPQLMALLERYIVSPLGKWRLEEFARQPLLASRDVAEESLAEAAEALGWLRRAEKAGSRSQLFGSPRRATRPRAPSSRGIGPRSA